MMPLGPAKWLMSRTILGMFPSLFNAHVAAPSQVLRLITAFRSFGQEKDLELSTEAVQSDS